MNKVNFSIVFRVRSPLCLRMAKLKGDFFRTNLLLENIYGSLLECLSTGVETTL